MINYGWIYFSRMVPIIKDEYLNRNVYKTENIIIPSIIKYLVTQKKTCQ
jgi:hypothetical protein